MHGHHVPICVALKFDMIKLSGGFLEVHAPLSIFSYSRASVSSVTMTVMLSARILYASGHDDQCHSALTASSVIVLAVLSSQPFGTRIVVKVTAPRAGGVVDSSFPSIQTIGHLL